MSDNYPQDSDAELNPTPPWPGNYEPPGWAFEREHGREPDTDDEYLSNRDDLDGQP